MGGGWGAFEAANQVETKTHERERERERERKAKVESNGAADWPVRFDRRRRPVIKAALSNARKSAR